MITSNIYKLKLQRLAGILSEGMYSGYKKADNPYEKSNERIPFNVDLMKQAIEQGMVVGILFRSNNDKYRMPITKYRIVLPVALGYDKKGEMVLRAVHATGQSEKKAIETGVRSAEAENEWRLFKIKNMYSMFFPGDFFDSLPIGGYTPNDSAMTRRIATFNPNKAKKYQAEYQKQIDAANAYHSNLQERKKLIRNLFLGDGDSK